MFHEEVSQILNQRKLLDSENSHEIEKCWNRLIELLSRNEADTVEFLKTCNKDEAMWVSEVFEEVAENLKSQKYIDVLYKVDKKFPELDLYPIVKIAENFMQ